MLISIIILLFIIIALQIIIIYKEKNKEEVKSLDYKLSNRSIDSSTYEFNQLKRLKKK